MGRISKCRKNALLVQIGVEIVWDNVVSGSANTYMYLASPTDFLGADDLITNLAKEREPGIEIIKPTPFDYYYSRLQIT